MELGLRKIIGTPFRCISGISRIVSFYLKYLWRSYFTDDVFFYGSALSFQVVLCLIPTVLLLIWILGGFLSRETLMRQIEVVTAYALPRRIQSVEEIRRIFIGRAALFTRHEELFGVVALVGFFWTSLGLIGTLRNTVFHVLRVKIRLPYFRQTLYDLRVLVIAGFFLTASTVVTTLFALLRRAAFHLPYGHFRMAMIRVVVPVLSGFGLTFLLYFSIYRFLSYGRLRTLPAAFGALWAAILFELAKNVFATYMTAGNSLSRVYGALEVAAGLLIWIFYSTMVFIVGAELANANLRRRAMA